LKRFLSRVGAGEDQSAEIMSRFIDQGDIIIEYAHPGSELFEYMRDVMEVRTKDLRELIPTSLVPEQPPEKFLETVASAVRRFVNSFCKRLRGAKLVAHMAEEVYGLYSCSHPVTGSFYLVIDDNEDTLQGVTDIRLYATKNREKAMEEYKKLLNEIRGGKLWLEEE